MKFKKHLPKQIFLLIGLISLVILTGCAGFNGIRKPLYDGKPVEPKEDAIEIYGKTGEVTSDEKEYYFRYAFSEDLTAESLSYPEAGPILLGEGTYIIGEDLPAGRATLLGNESVFSSENYEVHLGNMVIRDQAGAVYFENLFHSLYGQATVQLDLIAGHEINIVGTSPEITVFYEAELPEDPYVLMEPPILLVNMNRLETQQPIEQLNQGEVINLTAGIFEVGVHLDAGVYEVTNILAPHNTELYLFRTGEEPRVFDLNIGQLPITFNPEGFSEEELANLEIEEKEGVQIELQAGDKIYPNLVRQLQLTRISAE